LGEASGAIDELNLIATNERNAAVWSDLAAALVRRSDDTDDLDLTVDALAASDAALKLDSASPEASFNRALALTRLGLRFDARRAWQKYLSMDRTSPWADEALQRLHSLGDFNAAAEWQRALTRLQTLDPIPELLIRDAVRRFPQYARRWGETVVLGDWADGVEKGDAERAKKRLQWARMLASELVALSGERLLNDAVTAIDHAVANGRPESLAAAYGAYLQGRLAHKNAQPVKAEASLRRATELFEQNKSPMSYVSRYYLGSALHAQLRLAEASAVLDNLASEPLEAHQYRAAAAQTGWERGTCLAERGAISDAIDVFKQAQGRFQQLGETDLAGTMDGLIAGALSLAGDSAAAWRFRRRAFEEMSGSGNDATLLVILEQAAAVAAAGSHWHRAVALLSLTTERAMRQANPTVAAHAFTQRSIANVKLGDDEQARRDIAFARRWVEQLTDTRVRARAVADIALAEGLAESDRDPRAALKQISDSLRYYQDADRRIEIARLYLERARVESKIGLNEAARHDLSDGIDIVEEERRELRGLDQRLMLFAANRDLFENAIALAVVASDYEAAFDLSERHRARVLTEMFERDADGSDSVIKPFSLREIRQQLANDAAIVEYALIPGRAVLFVVRHDGLTTAVTNIPAAEFSSAITRFREAVRSDSDEVFKAAASAHDLLIEPVKRALKGASNIAFVVDRETSGVPFSALYDRTAQRFLAEDAAIITTASATLLLTASARARSPVGSSALTIGASIFDYQSHPGAQPLPQVTDEASTVASLYRNSRTLVGADATVANLRTLAPSYGVIHFAGHAVTADSQSPRAALLLAPVRNDRGELHLEDVAALRMPNVRLAVLAACDTAAGVSGDDGPENLALAFIAAGVPTAVASLWNVPDSSSMATMMALHRDIANGVSAPHAVRGVILSSLRDNAGVVRRPLWWSNIATVGGSSEFIRH
jgi:CHAT domain-containing protein